VILIDETFGEERSLMEQVIATAMEQAQSGDVVLLAPACASMDQFVSYADRGNQFSSAVLKIAGNQ
jgi:UDP-N-acetylmuramoylalanine--D-glutamate ligase